MPDHVSPRVRATLDRRRSNAAGLHDHTPARGAVERAVIDAELLDLDDEQDEAAEPVDLDAVIDAEVVAHRIEDSPLHGKTRLTGRIVTDPTEREQIIARIEFGRLPWYSRLFAPKPVGWRS